MSSNHNKLSKNEKVIEQVKRDEDIPLDPTISQTDNKMASELSDEEKSLKKVQVEIARMRLDHEKEEHELRKKQLKILSKITIYWLVLITFISLLQGFKGFHFGSDFELSNTEFITLMTTTTGTVLGLYTIAAIWLYKTRKEKDKKRVSKKVSKKQK
ncbi:hypothetical protein [Acinetobacter pollinis]|uniref:hypothetical protein n=1 Tax=Acinetobacter pollinis TaxID=2605270 RepID=UPI0018C2DD8E|nr:hypothetical protein [Acinetobacter pollinis]MBF7693294.1 hypothetical protein [Acinetobacter pollinis]MBF7699453.1 hypothetical protein [Acinetobacter pollinis]